VKDIAESRHNIPVSIKALTRASDCPRFRVQAALAHTLDETGECGKHFGLDQDREQQFRDWIQQNAEEDTQTTRGEIIDYCTSQVKIKFTREWVNCLVLHHSDEVIQTKVAHKMISTRKC
jgi:hypothetical protein